MVTIETLSCVGAENGLPVDWRARDANRVRWIVAAVAVAAFGYWLGYNQPIRSPAPVAGFGDGVHAVADLPAMTPGSYVGGAKASGVCEWERLSGPTPHRDVIERGRSEGERPAWVTIAKSDRFFWSGNCVPWIRAGD